PWRSRRHRGAAVEEGLEVGGDGHRNDGTDVGPAGVAQRVAADGGARTRDEQADELAGDLAAVPLPDPEAQHREMGANVGDGERLAEDVSSLEAAPLLGDVTSAPGVAGGGVLRRPGLADGS